MDGQAHKRFDLTKLRGLLRADLPQRSITDVIRTTPSMLRRKAKATGVVGHVRNGIEPDQFGISMAPGRARLKRRFKIKTTSQIGFSNANR